VVLIRRLSGAATPDPGDLGIVNEARDLLAAGGVIVFPTDTVYGLMAASDPVVAARRLNTLKGRAEANPVAALVNQTRSVFALLSELGQDCPFPITRLMPGPLTLVIPHRLCEGRLPASLLSLPYKGIGFRIPVYPALNMLIDGAGGWIMATSANPGGVREGLTLESCLAGLPREAIALAVDGGEVAGTASAVVEFTGSDWRALRTHPRMHQEASA